MARVDHKKIKQLIAQKKKTVTDRQLFTSRAMAAHFEDIAAAQTRRYGYRRRVKVKLVWKPKERASAKTDNNRIWLNAGHSSVTQCKTRQERYEQICGMFAHELGHVLYTDFLTSQTYHRRLESEKWYPEPPTLHSSAEHYAEADLWNYVQSSPQHKALLGTAVHEILNVLEDGYIEQCMISEYPGILGSCLQTKRTSDFELIPTVSQMVEIEEAGNGHIWRTILQNILSYMKWGHIKYGETPLSDPRIQVVFSMLNKLDQTLVSTDFKDRCRVANRILICCWPDIRSFMEECEERATSESTSGADAEDLIKALAVTMAGSSAESSGTTDPVSSTRAATAKLAAESAEEESPEEKAPSEDGFPSEETSE